MACFSPSSEGLRIETSARPRGSLILRRFSPSSEGLRIETVQRPGF